MSFQINTIDISTNAPALAPLAGREYTGEYTSLPNANLPKVMRKDLDTVFQYLTKEELPLDENTFLIKSRDSIYFRLFGPVLKVGAEGVEGTKDGELYVQWGPRFIPIQLGKSGFKTADGREIEAEFGSYNFSGRGEDAALFMAVDVEDGQTVLPVAVRFTDWENPVEPKAMNALVKKKPADIVGLLQKVTAKGSGGGNRIEATDEIDFRELDLNNPYEVIGYYPCKTSYGLTYRILINNCPEEGNIAGAWAHSSIRPLLATKPEINQDKPATLTLRSKEEMDNGRIRIRSTLLLAQQESSEEDLNLDF
jgi:hypothetical protein|tara:strand:+ start:1494 stop:2420 length:927 start_codon:yes stop_codon:yes gene_type:complete